MAYVVTGNCQDCLYTDCVTVCPVDCFYTDGKMMYINPEECIDCDACVPECPVEAIYAETEVPKDQQQWIAVNVERCASGELEHITQKRDPLPTAEAKKTSLGF